MDLFTFPKKALFLFCFLLISFCQVVHATTYLSTGAGGLWSNSASWSPAGVPTAGDIVTIVNGSPIQITAPVACATITISTGATLTMMSSMTVTGSFTVNGTLNCNESFIFGTCNFSLANTPNAFLQIGDPSGIASGATASGNIENTGGRSFPASANYVYDGIGNQNTGSGLPTTINGGGSLTINNSGVAPSNVVTLASNSSIQNLNLQQGNLSLTGKTITVPSGGLILNTGGNLATTGAGGADGGNFIVQGATLTGPTTFYNLTTSNTNSTITTSGLSSPLIDGTLTITSFRFGGTNSPRYAVGSTLSYNGPNSRGLEWNADLSTPPTIGVTQGYPDNVFINSGSDFYIVNQLVNGNDGAIPRGLNGNLTTSELTMVDWTPYHNPADPNYLSPNLLQTGSFTVGGNMIINGGGNIHMVVAGAGGPFIIKGSLTFNAGANAFTDNMSAPFTVGNGIIFNGGSWQMNKASGGGPNIAVTGGITISGGTINDSSEVIALTGDWNKTAGTYLANGGAVEFNGSAGNQNYTSNITGPTGENFTTLIIDKPSGNLLLNESVELQNLTFTKGLITTGVNRVNMNLGAAITGASQSTGWVNGNLQEVISATTPYLFAIGDATVYTPATITFSSVTTPGNVAMSTSTPFSAMPGYASFALSKTDYANRYWNITKNSGAFGNYTGIFDYGTTALTGTATVATLKTGVYDGTTWTYPSSSGAGTAITATNITALGAAQTTIALAICTPPTAYTVTGGGAYCPASSGLPVGLNNSDNGVNYQLFMGASPIGTPVAGTGTAIGFGNPTTIGTYTVVATSVAACTNNMSGSAIITASTPPTPTFTAQPGASVCSNTSVTYSTQTGESNYVWTFPGATGIDYTIISGGTTTDNSVTLNWLTAGSKVVQINYTSGCTSGTPASSTPTAVSAAPDASNLSIASTTPVCAAGTSNSTIIVNSTTLSADTYKVTYQLGAPNIATATATMIFSGGTGTFTVPAGNLHAAGSTSITITALDNSNTCSTGGLSATNSIMVNTPATPTFTIQPEASACDHTDILYATQGGESNYVWNYTGVLNTDYSITSGGGSSDSSVTVQWLISTGSKTVTVDYTNASNCSAATAISSTPTKINICNILPLYIPSGFDPNGKDPIWHIQNSEDYPNMQVQIYNRLGQKVFECQGYTAWNGNFHGQNLSAGVYVYVIKVNDERYKQILKGTITLIR
jgi:gliding motility-associated-like protein